MDEKRKPGRKPKAARKTGYNLSLVSLDVIKRLGEQIGRNDTTIIEDAVIELGRRNGIEPRTVDAIVSEGGGA